MGNAGRRCLRGLGLGLAGAVVVTACLGMTPIQFNPAPTQPVPIVPGLGRRGSSGDDEPTVNREIEARQLKRLREEHQKQIFLDADRMVQLATALKKEVDEGDKVSPDAMKSADEIGKLAKRVSERIKTQ